MSILYVNYRQLFSICGLEECATHIGNPQWEVGLSGGAAGISLPQPSLKGRGVYSCRVSKGERWKVKTENWKLKTENWKVKGERWKVKGENWKLKTENWKVKGERWKGGGHILVFQAAYRNNIHSILSATTNLASIDNSEVLVNHQWKYINITYIIRLSYVYVTYILRICYVISKGLVNS